MGPLIQTITLAEAARLELQGAMRRLQRALAEQEFFLAQHGETDQHQRHLLEIEIDEAKRQVAHAQQGVQWAREEQ